MARNRDLASDNTSLCGCADGRGSRREFLHRSPCALIATLAAAGIFLPPRSAIAFRGPVASQGTERSYLLPAKDDVSIDRDNDVILVRQADRVYAFSLACPHENTALRWRQGDLRFQCPRHESKYQPDGTFVSGRATRNMDRFALRLDGQKIVVDLNKLYRSDQQKSEWESATIKL
jgi:nitrite reductase/ring-hydroxylating ferredoxin subunit